MPSTALTKPFTKSRQLQVSRGKLPRRCHAMVVEWATLHRRELMENWEKAQQQVPLMEIEPLD